MREQGSGTVRGGGAWRNNGVGHSGPVPGNAWTSLKALVLSPTPSHPLDYGNRRRVASIYHRLQALGAAIHFLHYPVEEEWGHALPLGDQRHMQAAWDGYYIAPVTRPSFTPPAGYCHTIDEWWDPAIGVMLEWLFRVQSFDVFIVNYVWLSKALEFAPVGTIRILDTHDKFSGRRMVLEENGLPPEFFYTTEAEERIGLQRADVVWAIKPDEAAEFRRMCDRPVITVLHAEPFQRQWLRTPSAILRFGMIGSDNSMNAANFRQFLLEAVDFMRRTLLPCEFVIAGSCCDLLADQTYPFIRLMGRVGSTDQFYDSVDVVLGPMAFSTGLKVRIGEALCRGKAIVSHAHCFDGYPVAHPFHCLPSFAAMLEACQAIVRTPRLIEDLEQASLDSMRRTMHAVDRALATTLPRQIPIPASFVFVIDLAEIREGSLVLDHSREAALYVGHLCPVVFFLQGAAGDVEPTALARLRTLGRVFLCKDAAAATGGSFGIPGLTGIPTTSFDSWLQTRHVGFWFTAIPPTLPRGAGIRDTLALVPLSVLALRHTEAARRHFLAELRRVFTTVVATGPIRSPVLAEAWAQDIATHAVPSFWRGDRSHLLHMLRDKPRQTVTCFLPRLPEPVFRLVLAVIRRVTGRVLEFVYDDREAVRYPYQPDPFAAGTPPALLPLSTYAAGLLCRPSIPFCIVELGQDAAFDTLVELTDRLGIPRLSLFSPQAPRPPVAGHAHDRVGGVMESAMVLADFLLDEARFADLQKRALARYPMASDAGWNILWQLVQTRIDQPVLGHAGNAEAGGADLDAPEFAEQALHGRPVHTEILLHRQDVGESWHAAYGWAGDRGSKQLIASFAIRPLEDLAPDEIEYKGFGPDGRETPWVRGADLCGTSGPDQPLTGFAVRVSARLRDHFEVVYDGAFCGGEIAGPRRNGEACVATLADDPLEAMRIRLLERADATP